MSRSTPSNPPTLTPEQLLEIRKYFREECEFALNPMRSQGESNYQAALGFASHAIKAGFALNGGALVAIPAFSALLKVDPVNAGSGLLCALVIFTIGLVLFGFTTLFGYLSARHGELSWWHAYEGHLLTLILALGQNPQAPPSQTQIDVLTAASQSETRASLRLNKFAFLAAAGGFACFIVGAFISFGVMFHHAGTVRP